MDITATNGDLASTKCDLLILPVFQGTQKLTGVLAIVDKMLGNAITDLVTRKVFEGRLNERIVISTLGKMKTRQVAIIGLGKREMMRTDSVRKVGGTIARIGRECRAKTVAMNLIGVGIDGMDARSSAQALAEGLQLGAYRYHTYHGAQTKKDRKTFDVSEVRLVEPVAAAVRSAQAGIEKGRIVSDATMLARDLVNTPSQDMTPMHLADAAKALAVRGSGISCKVLDQKAMEKLGMHAALAVARGSMHPPVGIHLIYRPAKPKKTVALVGKAVTFDSGGLSLKPAHGMMTMKIDMAGAASVIGTFKALAALKPNVTVHGIFLAVENMPSGSAYRPGDVVTAMDGTTIEILNTDAEGRVTLADALSFAKTLKTNMIIDIATLTGSCVEALGEEVAAILTNKHELGQKILIAANEAGEELWEMPLYAPYAAAVRSKIADIKNIGNGNGGGSITAAHFLKTFVGETPWAHLDIAGPSYTERETRPDLPYGATGYGVRLLTRFLEKIGK